MEKNKNLPDDFSRYLEVHGWHFSEKLCDFAVRKMFGDDEEKIQQNSFSKDRTELLLKQYSVEVENNHGYDAVYVVNMAKSDFFGDSLPGQRYLARFVKNYLDDADGYEGIALHRYLADCIGKRVELKWDEFI